MSPGSGCGCELMADDAGMARGFICIGSAHWDHVGRSAVSPRIGQDVPGLVIRSPGGVALTIARAIGRLGGPVTLYSAVGGDDDGRQLVREIEGSGIAAHGVIQVEGRGTDRCMFLEGPSGQVTGISDCRLLEEMGGRLLASLSASDELRAKSSPWLVVDGNLPIDSLNVLAGRREFENATINFVVASDGKAERALAFRHRPHVTLYLNRGEAEKISGRAFPDAELAAKCLAESGFARVIVSDSGRAIVDSDGAQHHRVIPPEAGHPARFLGAGDNLVAGHLVARRAGRGRMDALEFAAGLARDHVAGGLDH